MNRKISYPEYGAILVATWILYKGLAKLADNLRRSLRTTKLRGPRSESWLFGVSRQVAKADSSEVYEGWAKEYGNVFQMPTGLGLRRTVICDPKAAAHFFAHETYTYRMSTFLREATTHFVRYKSILREAPECPYFGRLAKGYCTPKVTIIKGIP